MSDPVAVGTLAVAVSLRPFLELEAFCAEEQSAEENGQVIGIIGEDHRSGLLEAYRISVLGNVPGHANHDLLHVQVCFLNETEEIFLVTWSEVDRDLVNCQLYSGGALVNVSQGLSQWGRTGSGGGSDQLSRGCLSAQ